MKRIFTTGLAWTGLWLAVGITMGEILGIVDPDSLDPGDRQGVVMVFGSMGFLSGVAFAVLSSLAGRAPTPAAQSLSGAFAWGILGTAIVQLAYLNHGDAGLAANIGMAVVFSGLGGVIAIMWLGLSRWWSYKLRA